MNIQTFLLILGSSTVTLLIQQGAGLIIARWRGRTDLTTAMITDDRERCKECWEELEKVRVRLDRVEKESREANERYYTLLAKHQVLDLQYASVVSAHQTLRLQYDALQTEINTLRTIH